MARPRARRIFATQRLEQARLVGVGAHFLLGDVAALEEHLHDRIIAGALHQLAVVKTQQAAIAGVDPVRRVTVG